MTVKARFSGRGVTSFGAMPLVNVCETSWGYVVRSDTAITDRAVLIERVAGIAGATFLVIAAGQWFFPPVQAAVGEPARQMLASIGMALSGLVFLWIAARGLGQEVQVDLERLCLRSAVCNRHGRSRVHRAVGFDEIGSAFVKRSKTAGVVAKLYVRVGEGNDLIEVARGREATLTALHYRLSRDLHAAVLLQDRPVHPVRPVRPARPVRPVRAGLKEVAQAV
ncbi:MAG: hypothetical protein JXJ18_05390 [Rhodobacteraceae bacterium]|nr:hypothetical protein [Paracoccaceae bacterium]